MGNEIISNDDISKYGRLTGRKITQQQRLVGAQYVGSKSEIRSLGYRGCDITGLERQIPNSTEQLCAAKQADQTDTHY